MLGNTTAQTFGNGVAENYTFNLMGYLGNLNSINSNTGGGTGSPASSADNADTPTLPEWAAIIMAGLLLALNLRYTRRRTHGLALLLMIGLIPALTMNPLTMQSAYADTALGYDENHNVITRTTPLGTTNYGYDDLNRLNIESGTVTSQNIGYDANGNRISDGTANYTYTPNTDRIATISGQTVTMDAAGNITSAHNLSFAWNQAGQLKTVSQGTGTGATLLATYYYDYQGRRSRKETTSATPTTLYVYDQADHLLAEVRPPNTPLATYIWKDDVPVSVIVHSAAYHDANPTFTSPDQAIYLEVDQLNTPRAGRNQAGTTVWSWESDAFGSTAANNDPDGDGKKTVINLRFPGQYFDIESGLHYNHHRYYDPKLGDTFAYVGGNPLSYTDSKGLAYFAYRPLSGLPWLGPLSENPLDDAMHTAISHEQLFLKINKVPRILDSLVMEHSRQNLIRKVLARFQEIIMIA